MEEIDIKELIYYLYKKKIFIILAIILGGILSFIYTRFLIKPMYLTYSTILLSKTASANNNAITITQNDITLNEKLISTYSEILKSRNVSSKIKETLNLNISEDEISSNISISSKEDTGVLKLQVSNSDPELACNIANCLANIFIEKIKEIYNLQNFTIIDSAFINDTPYNVNYTKNIIIGLFLGAIISCSIIFIFFYFDTKVKSKEEIEELLGIDVLTVIPEIKL